MTQGRSYVAGLVTGVVVTGAVALVGLRATAAPTRGDAVTPTAIGRGTGRAKMPEPAVKVLLENAQVRVREVTFAPGAGDTHTHPVGARRRHPHQGPAGVRRRRQGRGSRELRGRLGRLPRGQGHPPGPQPGQDADEGHRGRGQVGGGRCRAVKLPYAEFDLSGLQSYPLASRPSKVRVADFARPEAARALGDVARRVPRPARRRRLQGGRRGDAGGARRRAGRSSGASART